MHVKSVKVFLVILILIGSITYLTAYGSTELRIQTSVFEKDSLKIINEALNYDKMKYKIVAKEVNLPKFWFDIPNEQLLVIILMIILIPLIIYLLFKYKLSSKKVEPTIKQEVEIEDIKKVDLDKLLKEALLDHNYRLALRYRFLIILQKLDLKKLVKWNKQKTNRNYVNEISNPLRGDFRSITNIFDRAWYGNENISGEDYLLLESRFSYFENLINEK